MFTECSLNVHWMFTECSLNVHWMFTECSLNVHWMFTKYSLNVHWMFPECSRRLIMLTLVSGTHEGKFYSALTLELFSSASCSWDRGSRASTSTWTECSLNVHWMLTECWPDAWFVTQMEVRPLGATVTVAYPPDTDTPQLEWEVGTMYSFKSQDYFICLPLWVRTTYRLVLSRHHFP